jgi:hypothetical protein
MGYPVHVMSQARQGGRILFRLVSALLVLSCVSIAYSQESDIDELPRPEFGGLTQKQVFRLIFSHEENMVSRIASLHLVTEAYVQSLGHRQSKGLGLTPEASSELVIDDKYFLAEVDLGQLYSDHRVERLLVGQGPWRNRQILTNAGAREELFPLGILTMFFVDLDSFDADRYTLVYGGRENIANTECWVFSVEPRRQRDSGRFRGQVWVDSSGLGIVRVKGVFTGPYKRWYTRLKGPERYFHFDSRRERIRDGSWVPNVTYFDERRVFPSDGNLEFHYRGYALLWQQPEEHEEKGKPSEKSSAAENTSRLEDSSKYFRDGRLISRLEADGLLGAPGSVEQRLDGIVQQIALHSREFTRKIGCRVLLTTPVEIFAVGDVIVVSRGLLDIVPDDSVLAAILARQVAHIVLGQTAGADTLFPHSLFDLGAKTTFPGLGIHWTPDQEAAADFQAIVVLKGSPYEDGIEKAKAFLSEVKSESPRFPNLVQARFGAGVVPEGSDLATPKQLDTSAAAQGLRFENRYRVSWHREIVRSEEQADRNTPEKRVSAHGSATSR